MTAFVINLPKRTDRLKAFTEQAKIVGIDFEVFPAFEGGAIGATKSHLAIAKTAKDRGLPFYTCYEDDAIFVEGFKHKFDDAFKDIPDKWDMVYMGASYTHRFLWQTLKGNVVRSGGCSCMHGYMVKEKFYDKIIAMLEVAITMNMPCDSAVSALHPHNKVYGIYPSIVKQSAGYSDIELKNVDYSKAIQ